MSDAGRNSAASAPEEMTHDEWWNSDAPASAVVLSQAGAVPYSDADASASLRRAGWLVVILTLAGLPIALLYGGWRSGMALAVGAVVSGSGLWEWRRLMAALTARMDAAEVVQTQAGADPRRKPSIGFAIAGFAVRLLVVLAVLYGSLSYLHGSVAALAAGLAMGVVSLTIESVRLLRSGTI